MSSKTEVVRGLSEGFKTTVKEKIQTGLNFKATKSPGTFRALSMGDIHLGHPRTPSEWIIRNINQYLNNDRVLAQVDALFITGDVYDRLLHLSDPQVHEIQRFITELLWRCARHDVIVRLVEGTPSHDREQSRFFVEQAQNAKIPVDLHYATTLSIEYIERFNINILYVPDKWRPHTEDTLVEVRQLLAKHSLERVDFAIMHGAFEYQLPSIVPEPTHDARTYLDLVSCFILIGHVHEPTLYERILAAGSFDRDTHGQEHPKGYYDLSLHQSGTYTITFVENQDAKRYDTIDCVGLEAADANKAIAKHLAKLPHGSSVKIRCRSDDPIALDLEELKKRYPQYEWARPDVQSSQAQKAKDLETLLHMDVEEFIPIDPTTVESLVESELSRLTSDVSQLQRCMQLLKPVVVRTGG